MAAGSQYSSRRKMKKLLVLLILLSGLIIPLACSDNNSNKGTGPTLPSGSGGSTPGGTPGTSTPTPASVVGTPGTPTPIPTFTLPTPVFQNNYPTTGSPSELVINSAGAGYVLTAAELQNTSKGTALGVEGFATGAGGTLNTPPSYTNVVLQGFPTPNSTPPWSPSSIALNGPQGFVNPGGATGYAAILDVQSNGGAILYTGFSTAPITPYNGWTDYGLGFIWEPASVSGYSGIVFKNPKGLAADGNNNVYVADTGNSYVEEFDGPAFNPNASGVVPEHFWNGFSGVTIGGTGVAFKQPSLPFKSPYAITCDSGGNVWVSDTGYNPSMVEEFTSGATTILESWPALPNSAIHGLTVDNSTNCSGGPCVYVADAGANIVEVYSTTGVLMTEMTNSSPSGHEGAPFAPSCIAFANIGGTNYIFVGDSTNDFIDVFH